VDMPSGDAKSWLVGEITWKAAWYRSVASIFPDDERCIRCSKTLGMLAAAVKALPHSHPLFRIIEQIDRAGDEIHARWLSELCLEFAHIAWFTPANTEQAINQLMQITYDSLLEPGNSTR
jgi:hypothetical protein